MAWHGDEREPVPGSAEHFKAILIDAAVVHGGYRKTHESDPATCLNAIIDINVLMALDRTISPEAERLYQDGFEAGEKAMLASLQGDEDASVARFKRAITG